jgi:hypothetical protein
MAKRMTNPVEPAFNYNDDYPEEGLNKREYFAVMAMQGILANSSDGLVGWNYEIISKHSVIVADALIAELNK